MMDQVGRQPILIMYTLGYNEVDPPLRDSDGDQGFVLILRFGALVRGFGLVLLWFL